MPLILIVEDDVSVSHLIAAMLKALGHEVTGIAVSAEGAYNLIEKKAPDLILMDIMIKGDTDGIDAAAYIKKKYDIPFIYLTALSDDKSVQRAKETEPMNYLLKPFDLKDLKTSIEMALYKHDADLKRQESQIWLKSTLESIGDGVIAADNKGKVKFMNSAAEILTGFSPAEAIGASLKSVYNTAPDNTVESVICFVNSGNKSNSDNYDGNKILYKKNETALLIEENKSLIINNKGEELGTVVTFRDVTKKREDELTIIAAKGFYLNFFEKFPVPIWRTNDRGEFNFFNSAWLDITGEILENQIFMKWIEKLHDDERDTFIRKFQNCFEAKENFEMEFRLADKYLDYRWMICVANPFYDLKGNFNGYVGLCLDITNRKNLEDELLKAKNLSDAANKSKSYFISNMSHEIRTPLNGITGLIEILGDAGLNSEQKEYLGLLKSSSNALLELLNNLLDYAKIEENKEKINANEFHLKNLLSEISATYRVTAKVKGLEFICSYEKDLPERVIGDENKLRQILVNLLSNALKFTYKGSISLNASVNSSYKGNGGREKGVLIHISVVDTGIGIPEEKQNLVFESFTQIDSSFTKKFAGTGLGLTIAKRLVHLMGGEIWLVSSAGNGSEFHFSLPFKKIETVSTETRNKINLYK